MDKSKLKIHNEEEYNALMEKLRRERYLKEDGDVNPHFFVEDDIIARSDSAKLNYANCEGGEKDAN